MRVILLSVVTLLLLGLLPSLASAQAIKVMTFNIRYDNPQDGINRWKKRKKALTKRLADYQPGIFGLQEALHHQLTYIDQKLPAYRYLGVGREDGKEKGEYSPIFYDTTQFSCIRHATFWLSESPDTLSVGWDAALERICTYALFEHQISHKKIWVFNTHFDHRGEVAREMSARLILDKIAAVNTAQWPVVLMGDFNSLPESKPVQLITQQLQDGMMLSKLPFDGPEGTFNNFDPHFVLDKRIDYVFVAGLDILSYEQLDVKRGKDSFISDHLPVCISAFIRDSHK